MKIHIAYDIKPGPWGGGNQMLKALRNEFGRRSTYEEDPAAADVILFNSFPSGGEHLFRRIYNQKKRGAIVIHRVDGPLSKIRNSSPDVDHMIYRFNTLAADGTVFQSDWSMTQNHDLGMDHNKNEIVIINAPDPGIFNSKNRVKFDAGRKTRLVATSWSPNPRKGFDYYVHLDEHLDHERYEMTFIGRSPVSFRNIRMIDPLSSADLAVQLKRHDIFITASSSDPCSNSLIEALHCGLPAVVLNDGGHPWIVGEGGESFNDMSEMLAAIERVVDHYDRYQQSISLPNLSEVATRYLEFAETVFEASRESGPPKTVSLISYATLLSRVYAWKFRRALSFWTKRH